MGCCGGITSSGNAAQAAALVDEGVAAGTLLKLVYVCDSARTEPFTIGGKVYQFGNNDRRRVNAISARLAPNFLSEEGRFFGCFEAFNELKFNDDGSLKAPDDFTDISGIGTAREEVLNTAGINTFAELAAQNINVLMALLEISESQAQTMIDEAAAQGAAVVTP